MVASYENYEVYTPESIRLYTLEEAEKILNRRKRIVLNSKRKAAIYFLKQKLSGLVMMGIGIWCPILMDGDATFSLATIPIGIWLLVTKRRVMDFKQ